MSVTHLVADTYPYRPGTTTPAGKRCAAGSAVPFIAPASRASRPSMTVWTGVPEVNPSTDVHISWSAPARIPASRSRLDSLVPRHREMTMYGPPIGSDTQHKVT